MKRVQVMKPDVEKRFRKAEETQREIEHLIVGGFYRAAVGLAYSAMLNAATAALLAREVEKGSRQPIVDKFTNAFVKTGLLDKKFHDYFRFAFNARTDSSSPSFASVDHRLAQSTFVKVKDFIKVCRSLSEECHKTGQNA
jgi:uncharacterized protein (UPF0332 family)